MLGEIVEILLLFFLLAIKFSNWDFFHDLTLFSFKTLGFVILIWKTMDFVAFVISWTLRDFFFIILFNFEFIDWLINLF